MMRWRQRFFRPGAVLAVGAGLGGLLAGCTSSVYPFQKSESVESLLAARPPGDGWKPATAADAASVDYETVYGPGDPRAVVAASGVGQSPSPPVIPAMPAPSPLAGPVPENGLPAASGQPPVSAGPGVSEPTAAAPKSASSKTAIRAVAVTAMARSGTLDNASLAQAMRETLAGAGWPVVETARKDALAVTGTVSLAPAAPGQQTVTIVWVVSAPGGAVLGTIRQANTVPAASLDQGWGPTARDVAEGAALGIFDLIKKYR